jgi:hypothetical protein
MFYEYIIKHHLQLYLIIGLMKYIRNLLSFYYFINVIVFIVLLIIVLTVIVMNL